MIKKHFKYIDLFAGIGGFHQAMRRLGGKCVYACEKDEKCIEFYNTNYNHENAFIIHDDIRTITPDTIPQFDVLCAGFPCQPFSKAGNRQGFQDKERGDLFYSILPIIDKHPEIKFIILENVRNLADNEANWDVIKNELMSREFIITEEPIILSPHQFGIPQIRERVYILGIRKIFRNKNKLTNGYIHLDYLHLDEDMHQGPNNCLEHLLDQNVDDKYNLPENLVYVLDAWNKFKHITNLGVVGTPIWMDYFGMHENDTNKFYRKIGFYSNDVPEWKRRFIEFNRNLYLHNKDVIDDWDAEYRLSTDINKLHRKFEWNCGTDCDNIFEGIIQIRQSGVRVKRPNFCPSLVAMVNTPIVWENQKQIYRYLTPREAAKLQSFDDVTFLPDDRVTYKQLGNSVNVNIIEVLSKRLFDLGFWRLRRTNNVEED